MFLRKVHLCIDDVLGRKASKSHSDQDTGWMQKGAGERNGEERHR